MATGWSGTRNACVSSPSGSTMVRAPGQKRAASARARSSTVAPRPSASLEAAHEHRDAPIGRPPLEREERLQPIRPRRGHPDAVDGVGREGDDRAAGQELGRARDPLGRRRQPVGHRGRSMRTTRSSPARSGTTETDAPIGTSAADRVDLVDAQLEEDRRSRCGVERHVGEQAAQQVEPVRAAVERDPRLEAERSDPRVDLGARDVRQVGGHDVGPGKPLAGRCQQVRRLERDGLRDAVCRQVLRGQRERVGRDVTRDEPQPAVGELAAEVQGQRQGDRHPIRWRRPRRPWSAAVRVAR